MASGKNAKTLQQYVGKWIFNKDASSDMSDVYLHMGLSLPIRAVSNSLPECEILRVFRMMLWQTSFSSTQYIWTSIPTYDINYEFNGIDEKCMPFCLQLQRDYHHMLL